MPLSVSRTLGMIALRDDAAVVSADCAASAEPVVVSAEVSVLSDAAASDCVSDAASVCVSAESDWVVSAFRKGMVQPPGMYTPVTAVTPRKQISSSTAIKETTLFFNESASLMVYS